MSSFRNQVAHKGERYLNHHALTNSEMHFYRKADAAAQPLLPKIEGAYVPVTVYVSTHRSQKVPHPNTTYIKNEAVPLLSTNNYLKFYPTHLPLIVLFRDLTNR